MKKINYDKITKYLVPIISSIGLLFGFSLMVWFVLSFLDFKYENESLKYWATVFLWVSLPTFLIGLILSLFFGYAESQTEIAKLNRKWKKEWKLLDSKTRPTKTKYLLDKYYEFFPEEKEKFKQMHKEIETEIQKEKRNFNNKK